MGNKNDKLVDLYVSGERNRNAKKAAYLIPDTAKVIGTSNLEKASVGIFYDDLSNPKTGGTGHTMKVCEENKVECVDHRVWLN